ncbi:MAG: hydrogenase maturation protease [Chloroflexi bacterium]|nr:hydrogenase maturation protease [Chloroflexota bacterium]
MKTLVLGLGNPILTDDGVGIHVVRAAAGRLRRPDVDVAEASLGGLRLLDTVVGYDRLILVDAIQSSGGRPGQVYRLGPGDLRSSMHSASSHDLSLPAAMELGRRLGMVLPEDEAITILAVEVEDVVTFGEACTPHVQAAIPRVAQMVLEQVLPSPEYGVAKFQVSG